MFFLISVKNMFLIYFIIRYAFVTVEISGFFIVEKNGHRAVSR